MAEKHGEEVEERMMRRRRRMKRGRMRSGEKHKG